MTVYILGSGFSQAAGGPLSNEINFQLFKDAKSKNSFVYRWISNHLYYNQPSWHKNCTFEELISKLDLYLHYTDQSNKDENIIKKVEIELLHQFIGLLNKQNLDYCSNLYEKFVKMLNPEDTIISFNYDLLIEKTLAKLGLPMPDFGISMNSSPPREKTSFSLYKLHGSINWSYCSRCNEVYFDNDNSNLNLHNLSAGVCIRKPLIIAPTLYKSYSLPKLRLMWKKAFQVLSETSSIYFIGYSIPRADSLVYQLLDLANFNNTIKPKVFLVNGSKANYARHLSIYSSLTNTNLTFEEWMKKNKGL